MKLAGLALALILTPRVSAQQDRAVASRAVPKTWDPEAIATLEVPLANPVGSPKHVSAEYYYRIPIAPIYRSYPVYAPGHEASRIPGLAETARA
jgi:hypothetical protein